MGVPDLAAEELAESFRQAPGALLERRALFRPDGAVLLRDLLGTRTEHLAEKGTPEPGWIVHHRGIREELGEELADGVR